jgi:DNA polymerase-1
VAGDPLLLIDGNSLTYRAFFALPTDLTTASGQVTNAVFGFTSMLINLMRDHGHRRMAVAFDRPEPTFRHAQVSDYKAGRTAAPDILRQQMGLVREVVETLGIRTLDLAGYEADDIIATLATEARDAGLDVIVVTGDRDVYALVEDPHVKVLYNRRGVSDYVLYDEAGIEERTGVTPALYRQYAALRGDPSDNLPGVPGVGEKTAAKLINSYGGLDGIFEHLDDQTPKLRASLTEHEAQVRQNAEVMKLVCDAPLGVTIDELDRRPADVAEVRRLFDFLEFHSLGERLTEALGEDLGVGGAPAEVLEAEVTELTTPAEAVAALDAARAASAGAPLAMAAAWAGSEGRTPLQGLALVTDSAAGEVAWLPDEVLADPDVRAALSALVALPEAGGRPLAAHQAKAVMRSLFDLGVDVRCLGLDTAIAAYLLDPAESRYLLDEVLRRYAGAELPTDGAAAEGQLDLDGSGVSAALRTARYALAVERLIEPLTQALDDQSLRGLNDTIEVPLVRVLARMEHVGVGVDAAELRTLRDRLSAEVESLRAQIWEDAGTEFNVNSTPQLREILFDKLGLAPQKKTKTGYSTDASSLEKLAGQHPIIDHLLAYREVEKLRSTYGDGLLVEVAPDGRIHATFNQTVARTGRLSSDQPNLHNIPVRSEIGRTFRRAFVPAPGCELLVADYNQIELRCIAHLAEDPGLIESFRAHRDIHTETASRVFGVEPGEVTIEQRSKAKMVSYGLAYGMEAYGLGQRLNIPTEEAALILAAYFEAFPAVRDYMDRTVAEARQRGYTETLFGRRRQIPELSSPNFRIRQAGERQAMNAGIQGLAADIFKVALVRIETALEEAAMASRLILQVHDEVLLDVPPAEREAAADLVVEAMAHAVELSVPLEVNLAFGPTWADAKG